MGPDKKDKVIINKMSELRGEIFKWLYTLSPIKIKDIFTIREPQNVKLLQKILNTKTGQKGQKSYITNQQITEGAFSMNNPNYQGIYYRPQHRFKFYSGSQRSKNQHIAQLAKKLYQNLVISRVPPHYMSIRLSFLQDLQTCMDELSRSQLLFLADLEGERINKSMWFKIGDLHSFAEWIVYMFQCELKKAYAEHREDTKRKNMSKIAPYKCPTFYEYVRQSYNQETKIKDIFQKVIKDQFIKDADPKDQNTNNKKNFLLVKSLDRLKEEYDKQQYLIQYYWLKDNRTNQNFQICQKVAEHLYEDYKQWKENKPFDDYLEELEKEKMKKIEKRKKKKIHRKQNQKVVSVDKEQSSESQNNDKNGAINQAKRIQKMIQIQNEGKKELQITKQQQPYPAVFPQIKHLQPILPSYTKSQQKHMEQKEQRKVPSPGIKKLIRQRINQYYDSFTNQLIQISSTYEKYRKVVYNVMYQFMREQIVPNLNKQQEQVEGQEWRLEIYGSASAGFSLRHSDIDLVMLINQKGITLDQIYYKLRLKQWAIDCKFIQAQIPIVTLKINLLYSPLAQSELTSKQLKRAEGELLSVDLTLSALGEPHSGIQNTKQLKQIYERYPNIRSICIFLKEYLRIRGLNKPYTGGIGSYVLIILIHAILTRKQLLDNKKPTSHPDNYIFIKQISEYMTQKFIPFQSVISSKKDPKIQPDKSIHLNIVDPKTHQLLKTSAFHIDKIVGELRMLRDFQEHMEEQLQAMNVNQKRNMKAYFMKIFHQYLYGSAD